METIIKHIPPFTIIVSQPGLPDRHINLNKLQVQEKIAVELANNLGVDGNKKLTQKQIDQASFFIRGAGAALQAVFADGSGALTDFFPPSWFVAGIRGDYNAVIRGAASPYGWNPA